MHLAISIIIGVYYGLQFTMFELNRKGKLVLIERLLCSLVKASILISIIELFHSMTIVKN